MPKRRCAALVALSLAGCALPGQDNPQDPRNRPEAHFRVADASAPGGGCLAENTEAGWPSTTDLPRGSCVALDAVGSSSPHAANLVYSFSQLDASSDADVVIAWLGSGSSPILELTAQQKLAMPLDTILRFRVEVIDGSARVSSRALARFTNRRPAVTVTGLRSIPVGPLPWNGATSVTEKFEAKAADPDHDSLAYCWTKPGRAPGNPADPSSCDSTTSTLASDIPITSEGVFVAHVVVDDGSGPSLPFSSTVAVRRQAPWVATFATEVAADPYYEHATIPAVDFVGPGQDASTITVDLGYYGFDLLVGAPADDPAATFSGGALLTRYPGGSTFPPASTINGPDFGLMSFSADAQIPGLIWITNADQEGRVRIAQLGAPPNGLSYFAQSFVVTTANDPFEVFPARIANANDLGWVGTSNGIFAYDPDLQGTGVASPAAIATPPAAGLVPAVIAARPAPAREAFVVWEPTTGSSAEPVLARYVLDASDALTVTFDPMPGIEGKLAFSSEDRLWAAFDDGEIQLLDVSTPTPLPILSVAAPQTLSITGDLRTGTVLAMTGNGSIAMTLDESGAARLQGSPEIAQPSFTEPSGAWWSSLLSGAVERSLGGTTQQQTSVVRGGPVATSYLDGGLWSATAGKLYEYSADGSVLQTISHITAGAQAVPLSKVVEMTVEPDANHAWLATDENGQHAIWRVDLALATTAAQAVLVKTTSSGSALHMISAPADGGYVWVDGNVSIGNNQFGIGTLSTSGAISEFASRFDGYSALGATVTNQLCLLHVLFVGTGGNVEEDDVMRLSPDGTMSAPVALFPTYSGRPFSGFPGNGIVADIEGAQSGNTCFVADFENTTPPSYPDDGWLTEVWSVGTSGTGTLELSSTQVIYDNYNVGADLTATSPGTFWLVARDQTIGDSRVLRFDRTGTGLATLPYSIPGASNFTSQ